MIPSDSEGVADMLFEYRFVKSARRGLTLVELAATILLIGIFSGVCVISFSQIGSNLVGEAEIVKAHLRYVRYLSLSNDQHVWRMRIDADKGGYTLTRDGLPAVPLPNEESEHRDLPAGLTVDVAFEGDDLDVMVFDNWGRPFLQYEITMTDIHSGRQKKFRVMAKTGFIEDV